MTDTNEIEKILTDIEQLIEKIDNDATHISMVNDEEKLSKIEFGTSEYDIAYGNIVYENLIKGMLPAKTNYQKIKVLLTVMLVALFRPVYVTLEMIDKIEKFETNDDIRFFIFYYAKVHDTNTLVNEFMSNWSASVHFLTEKMSGTSEFFGFPDQEKNIHGETVECDFCEKEQKNNIDNREPITEERPMNCLEKFNESNVFQDVTWLLLKHFNNREKSRNKRKIELKKFIHKIQFNKLYTASIKYSDATEYVKTLGTYAFSEFEQIITKPQLDHTDEKTSILNGGASTVDNKEDDPVFAAEPKEISEWKSALINILCGNNKFVMERLDRIRKLNLEKTDETEALYNISKNIPSTNQKRRKIN